MRVSQPGWRWLSGATGFLLRLIIGSLVSFFCEWFAPRFLITDHGRTRVRLSVASITAAVIIGFLGGLVVSFTPLWNQ